MNGIGNAEAYMQQMGYAKSNNALDQAPPQAKVPQTKDYAERRLSHQEWFAKLDKLISVHLNQTTEIVNEIRAIRQTLEVILERL